MSVEEATSTQSKHTHEDMATASRDAPSGSERPSDGDLHTLVADAIPARTGLSPLPGFKLDLSANPGFRKVFFKAGCDCGTSALLSVEVAGTKSLDEVKSALPSLAERLEHQAAAFSNMPCDAHRRLRLGPAVRK